MDFKLVTQHEIMDTPDKYKGWKFIDESEVNMVRMMRGDYIGKCMHNADGTSAAMILDSSPSVVLDIDNLEARRCYAGLHPPITYCRSIPTTIVPTLGTFENSVVVFGSSLGYDVTVDNTTFYKSDYIAVVDVESYNSTLYSECEDYNCLEYRNCYGGYQYETRFASVTYSNENKPDVININGKFYPQQIGYQDYTTTATLTTVPLTRNDRKMFIDAGRSSVTFNGVNCFISKMQVELNNELSPVTIELQGVKL